MLRKSPDTRFVEEWFQLNDNSFYYVECITLMHELISKLPWKPFLKTKRMVCSMGKAYPYSGQVAEATPFEVFPQLEALMGAVNECLGMNYNAILLNWYPEGKYVGIGAHADDEKELVHSHPIASLSLGAPCKFILTDKFGGDEKVEVSLSCGDMFLMGEKCQRYYKHAIPYGVMEADRISLTFREFN